MDLKARNNLIYLSLFVCLSLTSPNDAYITVILQSLWDGWHLSLKWNGRLALEILFRFKKLSLQFPLLFPLSKSWKEKKLGLCVCSRRFSDDESRFLLALFLILVLFISFRVSLQIVMSTENTHTSPVERLPGLLVCVSICVHSVISPASGRNWRITDLDWMLLTIGGCFLLLINTDLITVY